MLLLLIKILLLVQMVFLVGALWNVGILAVLILLKLFKISEEVKPCPKVLFLLTLYSFPRCRSFQLSLGFGLSFSPILQTIISKAISNWLYGFLPKIISLMQSFYLQGHNIVENVLSASELVHFRHR